MLTNARIALPHEIMRGTVVFHERFIHDIQPGRAHLPGALDLEGDFLIPGVIDLHTDNLERQIEPRGGVRWPPRSAFLAHDAICATAGITTVFDALCVADLGFDEDRPRTCREGAAELLALTKAGALRCDHFLHLRCELPAPDVMSALEPFLTHPALRMISIMDHTPGFGQYADLQQYRAMRTHDGEAAASIEKRIARQQELRARHYHANRQQVLERTRHLRVASHDDRTDAEIAANAAAGITIAEFPTTFEAAAAAHAHHQRTIAGAPNVVRGASHNGNVSARRLAKAGLADALASDYVPASLVEAAFSLADWDVLPLSAAISLVTRGPAEMLGLEDRGVLAPGRRADAVRVRRCQGTAIPVATWREGLRVA